MPALSRRLLLAACATLLSAPILTAPILTAQAQAQTPSFALTVRDHAFDPAELTVPAGKKFELRVTNADKTPMEFESRSLHREKVVPPGQTVTIAIGPLKPGRYEFEDEFHPKARGVLIAQ